MTKRKKWAILKSRETLDKDNLGTKIFEDLIRESFESARTLDKELAKWEKSENEYKIIIYGAIMMECGEH